MKRSLVLAIIATALLASCEKSRIRYIKENKSKILVAYTDMDSIEADGVSSIQITAKINSDADLKTVKFQTEYGKFLDSSNTYSLKASLRGDSLLASVYLIPTLEVKTNVNVNVSVPDVDTTLQIKFVNAYPDQLHIESTVHSIPNKFGSEVPVLAYLLRKVGTPSLHQVTNYIALLKNGSRIKFGLRAIDLQGSDANGIVRTTFILEDNIDTNNKSFLLIASCLGKNITLQDTLNIIFSP